MKDKKLPKGVCSVPRVADEWWTNYCVNIIKNLPSNVLMSVEGIALCRIFAVHGADYAVLCNTLDATRVEWTKKHAA